MNEVSISKPQGTSPSDAVREHARTRYLQPAIDQGMRTVQINVGQVHRALALRNRIPLVCQALKSEKFLAAHGLRIVSQTGPPSGQSTTVTFTYEFMEPATSSASKKSPWSQLRGALRSVFTELGGGENYLRRERQAFESRKQR
jgi:5-methylcytosine-specific restriction enzyme B